MEQNFSKLKQQKDIKDIKRGLFTINLNEIVLIGILWFVFLSGYSFNLYDSKGACVSRWKDSNQTVQFTKESGCTVKIDNVWVKETNIQFKITED